MYKVVAVGVFAIITHAYMINLIYIEVCQSWNEWLKTEAGLYRYRCNHIVGPGRLAQWHQPRAHDLVSGIAKLNCLRTAILTLGNSPVAQCFVTLIDAADSI